MPSGMLRLVLHQVPELTHLTSSGITITSGYAIRQCSNLLKVHAHILDKRVLAVLRHHRHLKATIETNSPPFNGGWKARYGYATSPRAQIA